MPPLVQYRNLIHIDFIINQVFNSRTYILSQECSNEVWLVDCGDVEKLPEGINVGGVLLTHTHSDHIYGLNTLLKKYPSARIYTNEFGKLALQDSRLNISAYHTEYEDIILEKVGNVKIIGEGSELEIFGQKVSIYETPGHDPSCLCYKIGDHLFTGDSYIPGIKVFTGFPKGNRAEAKESLDRILQLVKEKGLNVCPGHEVEVGSSVVTDVPDNSTIVGVPAKVVK